MQLHFLNEERGVARNVTTAEVMEIEYGVPRLKQIIFPGKVDLTLRLRCLCVNPPIPSPRPLIPP